MLGGKDNDDYNHFNFPVEVALMVSVHLFSFLSYVYEKYLNEILFTVNHNSQFLTFFDVIIKYQTKKKLYDSYLAFFSQLSFVVAASSKSP